MKASELPQVFDLAATDTKFEIESEYDFSPTKVESRGQQPRREACSVDDDYDAYHRGHITLDELLERVNAHARECLNIV